LPCDEIPRRKDEQQFDLINALFIFVLAGFIGFEVIRRVSPLLHTPLMSLTNALDAIAVVGAIVLVGEHEEPLSTVFGFIAVVAATSNIVGGFLITDRMLKMFKSSRPARQTFGQVGGQIMTAESQDPDRHRASLSHRERAVHPLAEVDEFADHRPPRHLGRRNRHGAGDRRHSAESTA
jgi:H+-translocating NAD(P) transhydrogenase subunit alpha